ncbi:MAG: lipid A export permease/ATP-binding protein MsbA [Thermodesulfobacteriota bacterium]
MNEKELLARFLTLVKPYRGRLAIAMVAMALVAAFGSAQAYMIKPVIDKIFIEKNEVMLRLLPFALILIFLGKGAAYYIYSSFLALVGQAVIRDLRKAIFDHIHSLPLSFFHNTSTGEIISRVINDVTTIQAAVSRALVGILRDALQVVGLIGVLFYLNWRMAIFTIFILPLAILPVVKFGQIFRKLSTNNQEITAQISSMLHETIVGHRIVKAFGMERYESGRFATLVNNLFAVMAKDVKFNSLQHPVMELFGGALAAGFIAYGGSLVFDARMTTGEFFAFLAALVMTFDPIKRVSTVNSLIQQGLAGARRVFAILDVEPDITDDPAASKLPPFKGEVRFNDVSFSYDGSEQVLSDINLTVPAGQILAIVGPSGGGKTTLVNLLPRFFEVSKGAITIDGEDLRDVTMASLRDQQAIVSQETVLFNDTVRNNIAYGDLDRSLAEIEAAARSANALEFIRQLPEGFDTVIGESGTRLSGGQRQRLSIARALLKNSPILILDEATSALDTESEREVQMALENLMRDRTTFVIAHRLSTIRRAHRIIVIDQGRIVESGSHDELLTAGGVYRRLYTMQVERD